MPETATRTPTKPRCPGTRKDGSPCRANPTASGWCPWHDPHRTEAEKLGWARDGGLKATRHAVLPEEPDPTWTLPEHVEKSVTQTHGLVTRGQVSPEITSVRLRAAEVWMRIWEARNLREQLEALERLAGQKLQRTWG